LDALRGVAFSAALSVYILIVVGGVVTATGSGLACPDWPLCNGKIVPELSGPVLIEYAHRLWALLAFILVTATAALAWKRDKSSRLAVLALATFVGILAQVFLGMVTVQGLSHPYLVTAHLALATLVFGLSAVTAVLALTSSATSRAGAADRSRV
jgi:heme A synthase